MLLDADVRLEIDEALRNKDWKLSGKDKNVFTEKNSSTGCADYILKPKDRENPLVIIEAKRKGRDLNEALKQAQEYAEQLKSPIAYASDGSTVKTIHLSNLKPLMLNGGLNYRNGTKATRTSFKLLRRNNFLKSFVFFLCPLGVFCDDSDRVIIIMRLFC